jgi:cytosine/uracil/thiamine/allantoin permease
MTKKEPEASPAMFWGDAPPILRWLIALSTREEMWLWQARLYASNTITIIAKEALVSTFFQLRLMLPRTSWRKPAGPIASTIALGSTPSNPQRQQQRRPSLDQSLESYEQPSLLRDITLSA